MDAEEISAGMLAAQVVGSALSSAASSTASALVGWVRERFHGSRELERVEDAPDSPSRVRELGELIETEAAKDSQARGELQQLLESLKDAEPTVVQQAIGNQNVTANNSTVYVTFPDTGSSAPSDPPMSTRWLSGETHEVVYNGPGLAREVDFEPLDAENLVFDHRDDVPQNLRRGEGLSFLAARHMGTTDDRLRVTWIDEDGESNSMTVRVPRRGDK